MHFQVLLYVQLHWGLKGENKKIIIIKKKISPHISRPFVKVTTGWGSRFNGHTNYKQAL